MSPSSGGGSPRSESQQARSGSGEGLRPGLQMATFSLCVYTAFPHCVHRERQVAFLLVLEGDQSHDGFPPSRPP